MTLGKGVTPNLAVSTAGAILAGWTASPHETTVSAGTVSGGWSAPVTLGPATAYKQPVVLRGAQARRAAARLALAASGQGVALWTGGNGVQAATLNPGGTWTAPVILASSTSTVASGLAADATGGAVALLTQTPLGFQPGRSGCRRGPRSPSQSALRARSPARAGCGPSCGQPLVLSASIPHLEPDAGC